jgi:hypothetical protein
MLKFLKNMLFWSSPTKVTINKEEVKYYVDHLALTDKQLENGLHFAILVQVNISASKGGEKAHIFNVNVSSVQVAGLDPRAKTYMNNVSNDTLKATVATMCLGAGEYSMQQATPVNKANDETETKSDTTPPLPSKDTLLN